jgi:pimeloyl-ACP methyl ester carboxylesterase
MVDSATDVVAIADAVASGRFAVVGISGGGGHALAVAAGHPERVSRCATIVADGPAGVQGFDLSAGMPESGVKSWSRIMAEGEDYLTAVEHPQFVEFIRSLPEGDEFPGPTRDMLFHAFSDSLGPGPGGFVDDYAAAVAPWGFDLAAVACPTQVMVAADDTGSSRHGEWLSQQLELGELVVVPW